MPQTASSNGITFAVDHVTPATEPLAECRAHEAVRAMLDGEIESCSDYHGSIVADIRYQPLLAAVYTAFSQHRPLALSPDAVWVTIARGVGHHMAIHGERLRARFVSHQGKITLEVKVHGWVEGSPENPWPEAFAKWAGQIRDHVGHAMHDALVCDFSTSGPLERAVSQIVMMDIFERYFAYRLVSVCGIPTVTLEGTAADWERLLAKVRALRVFDIDWWLDHLEPICEHFVRASRGDVDLAHWQDICKLRRAYGGDIINGWVAKLFPYLRAYWKGPCNRRNPIFDKDGEGFQSFVAPPGLSRVPFTWVNGQTGKERAMEAIGGLVGVAQDAGTLALRPKLGWAVREEDVITSVLYALRSSKYHTLRPGLSAEDQRYTGLWPKDMAAFYAASDGAELFRTDVDGPHLRLLTAREIADDGNRRWPSAGWYRIATLSDGSWLAMNRNPEPGPFLRDAIKRRMQPGQRPCAICVCGHWTISRPGKSPVVALSFGQLLDELVKSHGRPYWLQSEFEPYGEAEQFTRHA